MRDAPGHIWTNHHSAGDEEAAALCVVGQHAFWYPGSAAGWLGAVRAAARGAAGGGRDLGHGIDVSHSQSLPYRKLSIGLANAVAHAETDVQYVAHSLCSRGIGIGLGVGNEAILVVGLDNKSAVFFMDPEAAHHSSPWRYR